MEPAKLPQALTRLVVPKRSLLTPLLFKAPLTPDPFQYVLMPQTGPHTEVESSAAAEQAQTTPSLLWVTPVQPGRSRTLGLPVGVNQVISDSPWEILATFSQNPTLPLDFEFINIYGKT